MSKRFNLREFQQQVLDRLQQQASGGAQVSTLGVQVGRELWQPILLCCYSTNRLVPSIH